MPDQWSFTAPPTAYDGMVYLSGASYGGYVYAVSEADGRVRWEGTVANGDKSSPAVDDSGAYVSYDGQQDHQFNPSLSTRSAATESRSVSTDQPGSRRGGLPRHATSVPLVGAVRSALRAPAELPPSATAPAWRNDGTRDTSPLVAADRSLPRPGQTARR